MSESLSTLRPFVRFADVTTYTSSRTESITRDSRLLFGLEGVGHFTLDGHPVDFTTGTLILFQPGTPYSFQPEGSFSAISIDFDFTDDYACDTAFYPPISRSNPEPGLIHPRFTLSDCPEAEFPIVVQCAYSLRPALEKICEEKRYPRPFGDVALACAMTGALVEVLRLSTCAGRKNRTLDQLLAYIAAHYSEDISNERIGKALNYDACYLNRLILTSTGRTLHQYVLDTRINAAIRMLLTTDTPIDEIAAACGFASGAHFSNLCLKKTGNRPSDYRRSHSVISECRDPVKQ